MKWYQRFDWIIFLSWLGLSLIGLVAIYSATQGPMHADTFIAGNFIRQVIHVGLGVLLIVLIQLTAPQSFQNIAYLLYVACLFISVLTIFFGIEVGGERNWLNIGGFRLQISEFMKTATVLALAAYLTSNRNTTARDFKTIFMIGFFITLPVGLITLMGDTGTSLIYIAIVPIILFWSGLPYGISLLIIAPALLAYFSVVNWVVALVLAIIIPILIYALERKPILTFFSFATCLLVVIGIQVMLMEVLQPHQKARVEAFLDPESYRLDAGWNVIQAKTAIASGGITGKGFMQGTQTQLRFLPEQQTDFIFCVVSEEFGFIGAGLLLFLFFVLLSRMLYLAVTHKHPFAQITIAGFLAVFIIHVIINLGMAMALLPVIGIPLPLISYGGSSFLSFSIMIGIVLNFYMHERTFSIYAS